MGKNATILGKYPVPGLRGARGALGVVGLVGTLGMGVGCGSDSEDRSGSPGGGGDGGLGGAGVGGSSGSGGSSGGTGGNPGGAGGALGGSGGSAGSTGGAPSSFVGCEAGETQNCVTLAKSYASGIATCRSDLSGFDVTTCALAERTFDNELVKPKDRDATLWGDALSNNGASWSFEVSLSPTKSKVWVIRLGGGGFCDDYTITCVDRSWLAKGVLVADGSDYEPSKYTGIRRRWVEGPQGSTPNDSANPDFWDANFAQFNYKSSTLWLGDSLDTFDTSCRDPNCVLPGTSAADCDNATLPNGQPCTGKWYRRGRINIRAGIETLIQRYGLDDADAQVLFAGTSAGAFGVMHNADVLATLLPAASARGDVKLLVDGAWAADWSDPSYRMGDQYSTNTLGDGPALTKSLIETYKGTLLPNCTAAKIALGQDPNNCILSHVSYPFLTSPPSEGGLGLSVFVQKSAYDSIEMAIHLDATHKPMTGAPQSTLTQWTAAQESSLASVPWLFSGDCPYHTTIEVNNWWTGVQPLVSAFWNGEAPSRTTGPAVCPPPKTPAQCNDSNPLTTDYWLAGNCYNYACFVDAECGAQSVCRGGQCVPRECYQDAECDDGNPTTLDRCTGNYVCEHT